MNRSFLRKFLDVVKLSFSICVLAIMMSRVVCCHISNERRCHTADLPSGLCRRVHVCMVLAFKECEAISKLQACSYCQKMSWAAAYTLFLLHHRNLKKVAKVMAAVPKRR